jgi:hypothetical protein
MKTINILQVTLLIALSFTSCKKENFSERIVGKWQIQEVFNGYSNGGDFRWSTVPSQYQSSLEFNANGGFKEVRATGFLPAQCTGIYRLLSNGEIQVLSDCSATPYNLSISVSNKVLTITHFVREGEVKEKFIKVE